MNTTESNAPHGGCFHCGEKTKFLQHCPLWGVWACKNCIASHHHPHHESCESRDILPTDGVKLTHNVRRQHFTIYLTRYDGIRFSVNCKRGQTFSMEDHWLGTYISYPSGMTLVLENRETINQLLIKGLATLDSQDTVATGAARQP